jgi:hypothetical protein
MQKERPYSWTDLARFLSAVFAILATVYVYLFIKDPYGRWGFRSSSQVSNLAERELLVPVRWIRN